MNRFPFLGRERTLSTHPSENIPSGIRDPTKS